MHNAGKGDKRRPGSGYSDNYDQIDWSSTTNNPPLPEPDIHKQTKAFCDYYLAEGARELLAFQETSILPDGRVRELARMWEPLATHNSLSIAESAFKDAALRAVAK